MLCDQDSTVNTVNYEHHLSSITTSRANMIASGTMWRPQRDLEKLVSPLPLKSYTFSTFSRTLSGPQPVS